MATIAVTGAGGFIGKNLMLRFREAGMVANTVAHQLRGIELHHALAGADFIIHLAGVNRADDELAFVEGNLGLTEALVAALEQAGAVVPIVYASSIHAGRSTAYGRSKRAAEVALEAYGARSGAPVKIFRLPNVFGKWCRPNYNSVVATFCHNIVRDLPIVIEDPAAPLSLVYVDDVVGAFLQMAHDGLDHAPLSIEPVYKTTVGELARQLQEFRASRETLATSHVGTGYLRALHATYLSYLEPAEFHYPLTMHTDPRGSFVEMLRTPDSGQLSYFTAHPGVTRGGHYHHTKTEKFLVVEGEGRFRFRHILTGETYELVASGTEARVVETVPGWVHDITNIGDRTMVVMLWASELFDPQAPDTFPEKV